MLGSNSEISCKNRSGGDSLCLHSPAAFSQCFPDPSFIMCQRWQLAVACYHGTGAQPFPQDPETTEKVSKEEATYLVLVTTANCL